MFIGHIALGLAAKRATPRLSLAILLAAALFADILWPILIFAGVEEVRILPGITKLTPLDFVSYPWSHSLMMLIVWGVAFGWIVRRRDPLALPVVAALVVSHWVLDFVTHRPDMPLYPGSAKYGLGLWNSLAGTLAVEVPLFVAGAAIYFSTTRAKDKAGTAGIFILLATLLAIYAGDIMSDAAPPSPAAIGLVGIAGAVIFTAWSAWADRHRELRP
jgi:hypothetical protein